MSNGGWALGRRPALDGVRGIAVLLVVVSHLHDGPMLFTLGSTGVMAFFTLSGFLITSLLVERPEVRLRTFYRNRALRLMPALGVLSVVMGVVLVMRGSSVAPLILTALYVANWGMMLGYWSHLLMHTWSLAVEEQFYLVWPILLLAVRRWRNGAATMACLGIVLSAVLRFGLWSPAHMWRVYAGSDTEAGPLLVGCLLALLAHRGLPALSTRWVPVVGVGACVAMSGVHSRYFGAVWAPTLVPLAAAAVIWSACSQDTAWLSGRVIRYVGRRSYALYLWHYPLVMLSGSGVAPRLAAVAAGFVLAEVSWRVVESPMLARRASAGQPPEGVEPADELRGPSPVGGPYPQPATG